MFSVCCGATFWPGCDWEPTTVPAELRIWVASVRLEAMVEPTFLKSTVTLVDVPDVGGLGEIACKEMWGFEVGDGVGVGDGLGAGAGGGLVGAEPGEGVPAATLTENDFVARPAPPCHSSKPASTSIRYHELLM